MGHKKEESVICGITKVSDDLVEFTKDVAESLESLPKFMGDRGFKENHKNFLAGEMEAERFLGDLTIIVTCFLEDIEYNLNLKHSSSAALEQEKDWEAPGLARKIVYRAETEDDLRTLYTIVDGGVGRTFSDKVIASTYGKKEFEGISKTDILKLIPGYRQFVKPTLSDKNRPISSQEIADGMLTNHLEACKAIKELLQAYTPDRAYKWQSYVVFALFMTYEHHREEFYNFWVPIVRPDLPVPEGHNLKGESDPRNKLSELLKVRKFGEKGEKINGTKMKLYCLWAFIQWSRNKAISRLMDFPSAQKLSKDKNLNIFEQFKDPTLIPSNIRKNARG